jgi:hypothetical protein
MTVWKPLTCSCEIEFNDGDGNWVRTIKKCNLHKEYTGQKLLDEVRKHNIQNSKRGEPGVMEFYLGVNFEPDWLKQVRKHPSVEKIREAEFNLGCISEHHPTQKEFQYALSNFLNSSRSILWYLLEEYGERFNLEIEKYYKDEKYRSKHQRFLSSEAARFVNWYQSKFENLMNDRCAFLLKKRDFNIHSGYVSQIFKLQQGPYRLHEDDIKRNVEIPVDLDNVTPFFPEANDKSVLEICHDFLTKITQIVNDTHDEFPIT